MTILAIDPGPEKSALVQWDGTNIIEHEYMYNQEILHYLPHHAPCVVAIERIRGYGIPAGNTTFDTCEWVGRFQQQAINNIYQVLLIPRADVLSHFGIGRKDSDRWLKEKLVDEYPSQFPEAKRNKKGSLLVKGWSDHHFAAFGVALVAEITAQGARG